ncbi:MAG: hypothetical protein ACRDRQ_26435 [Pseudonocardiaceae bacterium]
MGNNDEGIIGKINDGQQVFRYYGGQGDLFSTTARLYTRWIQVPATEEVQARLAAALAELHTLAGWTCHDSGMDGSGHFTRALWLSDKAGDDCGVASAACQAGLVLLRNGQPNYALKFFQLGHIRLQDLTPSKSLPAGAAESRVQTLTARLNRTSATAYAAMGGLDEATNHLAKASEGDPPPDAYDHAAADLGTARVQLDLGQLDATEQSATSAVRTYRDNHHRRGHTMAELVLAEVYLRAGDPRGLTLAHEAITKVTTLQSVAVRRELLIPLATALETRPGGDSRDLARTARQLATTPI